MKAIVGFENTEFMLKNQYCVSEYGHIKLLT
jgi:hypothetical protein